MTAPTISSTAAAAREAHRDASGRFGTQPASEAELDLSADLTVPAAPSRYAELKGEDRVEAMKKDLSSAVDDVVASGQLTRYLDAAAGNGMRRWSTGNRLLAGIQLYHQRRAAGDLDDPEDPDAIWQVLNEADCRTFNQWKEQDRAPVKGSKAIYILAPVTRKVTEEDARTGEERTRSFVAGFRGMAVFDVSQTDGEPLPEHPSRPFTGEVAAGTVEGMKARVAELGYTYGEKRIPGTDPEKLTGTLAYVRPSTKEVVVDERLSDPEKAAALAHELGHIECGHTEGEDAEQYSQHRGRMETEAEAFAYMMMRSRGAEPDDAEAFSPGYIAGWSKGDTRTVQKALDTAGRAFARSDEAIDWPDDGQDG